MSVKELLKYHGKPEREVYLDLENGGVVPEEVLRVMEEYYRVRGYGHPSITNKPGWEAYEVIYETKEMLAKYLGGEGYENFVFTHSGTEANNLALMGVLRKLKARGKKVVTSAIEHLSVIFPLERVAEELGMKVMRVPVDSEGFVDPEILKYYLSKDVVLVSIQLVNHEIGTVQNLKELVKTVKDVNPNVIFHTDACDALGRLKIDLRELNVDLATFSSHKVYGPRGVGVLYVSSGIELEPVMYGQLSTEKLWPGVENVQAIAGFRKALELAFNDFEGNMSKVRRLRDRLWEGIRDRVDHILLNGPKDFSRRAPDNLNVSFLFVEGEALTVELSLRGVYVSSGSACTSRVLEPSHVLLAIGRKHEEAHGSILFKVWRYHSDDDIDYVVEQIPEAVRRLRRISSIKPES